ncbi:hypothetical protein Asch01_00122 [Acinetobacter schindleri]
MRNLAYLIGGNTLAQFITIVLSPILSRIYSPKEFGLFGSITSIVYFLNSFSLMRLEVELLKNKHSKEEIYKYAISVLFIITMVVFLFILIFKLSVIYYILPVLLILSGYYNLSYYNLLLENNVRNININKITLAISIGISQLFFGYIGLTGIGLILGHLVGFFVTLLMMKNEFYGFKIIGFFEKFKNNIYFDAPSMALNVVSNHGPTLLIFGLLGGVLGGAYYMAFRVLILPISVISSSLSNYIGANYIKWKGDFSEQKNILEKIIIFTSPFLFLGYYIIDDLILLFLGDQWLETSLIAKVSVFWLYMRFLFDGYLINFSLLDRPNLNLGFQIFSIIIRSTSIFIPYFFNFNFIDIIKIFCLASFFTYLMGLFLIFYSTGIKSKLFNIFVLFLTIFYFYMENIKWW